MTQCKYCHKNLAFTESFDIDNKEMIAFCNRECLDTYVFLEMLIAKQDAEKLERDRLRKMMNQK